MRRNKGITLVALILTIIVMLILVGVSISVLINSDLIGTAQNAGDRTETAYGEEGSMGGITVGNKNYDNIQDYIDGKGWETLFEGEVTTTNGQALLTEDVILFNTWDTYRITVDSEEFTGKVSAVPLNDYALYVFFAISEEKAITFSSMEDAQNKIASLGSCTLVAGYSSEGLGTGIAMQGATCEYTIKKIEVSRNGKLLYSGNLDIIEDENTELPFHYSLSRQYRSNFFM